MRYTRNKNTSYYSRGCSHTHCMPNHVKFLCRLFLSPYSFLYCLVSSNLYQSQGHEFDSWWAIVKGEIVAGCKIVPWRRPGGPSHNPSRIPSRKIAEGKIVVCGINCLVTKAKWVGLQSNRDAETVTLLSKKSCVRTNNYNFWQSGKCSIQHLILTFFFSSFHPHNLCLFFLFSFSLIQISMEVAWLPWAWRCVHHE